MPLVNGKPLVCQLIQLCGSKRDLSVVNVKISKNRVKCVHGFGFLVSVTASSFCSNLVHKLNNKTLRSFGFLLVANNHLLSFK